MAYIEPKTNWIASNIPVASDLNRIEGNTKQNHDDVAAEAIARAADVDASVAVEESARIAADKLNLHGSSLVSRLGSSMNLSPGDTYILPAGSYCWRGSNLCLAEVQTTNSGWTVVEEDQGFIISDGVNVRLRKSGTSTVSVVLVKIF